MKSKIKALSGLLCILLCFMQVSCGNTGSDDKNEGGTSGNDAPSLPSPFSLSMNLSVSDQGANLDAAQEAILGANHLKAMVYVLVVNVNVAAHLSVPVALLQVATSSAPILTAPGVWTWSISTVSNNRTWSANLSGERLTETSVAWQMRVSSSPIDAYSCCDNFLFLDGQSNLAGSGSWQIYDPTRPSEGAKLFSVTYEYASQTSKTLLMTVNSDKAAAQRFGTGSYVRYQANGDLISMELSDSSEPGKRLISWSASTKAGSHTDPQGNKSCWGTSVNQLVDTSCE